MSLTTKQFIRWTWDAAVKAATHDRELQLGELTKAVNVRRLKDGPPRKRLGYDKTTVALFHGGTYSGPPTEITGGDHLQVRDSTGGVYSVEGGHGYFRGTDLRAFPRTFQSGNAVDRAHKPVSVMTGSDMWCFSLGIDSGGASVIQLTILDPLTREVKRETESIQTHAFDVVAYTATVAAGVVWLFYIGWNSPKLVRAMKFLTVTSAPVDTAFTTCDDSVTSIDSITLASGAVIVAASGFDHSGGFFIFGHRIAILNASTGAASSAATYTPGTPADTRTPAAGGLTLFGDGVNGSVYVSYWAPSQSVDDTAELWLHTHNATSLARTSVSLGTESQNGLNPNPCLTVAGGYLAANGNRVVFSTILGDPSAGNLGFHFTKRYTYNGSSTAVALTSNWAYVASRPFQVGSSWYLITGFDDDRAQRLQRGYFLRDVDGNIVSTILDSDGVAVMHAGGLAGPTGTDDPYAYHQYSSHVVAPIVSGTDVFVALMTEGLTSRAPSPVVARVSFSEAYHSDLPGVIGGGVPKFVGASDHLRELAPMLFPHRDLFIYSNGAGPGVHSTNICTYLFATKQADGSVTRSAPRPLQKLQFYDRAAPPFEKYVLRVQTLSHAIGQTFIEIYGSAPAPGVVPFLQHVIPNNPAVQYIDIDVYPFGWNDAGESLYSLGAALENQSVPPARLATIWRDRPWLGGTADGRLWPGFEHADGNGYRFNSVLAFRWAEGTGEQTSWCAGGWDFMAVFKRDAVGIITGSGPDGIGLGAYEVQTLSAEKGVSMSTPGACGRGPMGVYFQNASDLRVCVVSNGSVGEIHRGMETYAELGYVVTDVVHDRAAREMLFYCSNGKIMVLDYAHPTGDQSAGQWYLRESAALVPVAGAVTANGRVVHVDDAGTTTFASWTPGLSFDDDDTEILADFETGLPQLASLLGEFDTFELQLSSTALGDGASSYTYTLTNSLGVSEPHSDVSNATADVTFMTGLNRTREFRLRIQETSSTGEGRLFDGGVLEVGAYRRPQDARRRIG